MGFYIRKSISAGPFRFNLSGSGVGMSVGVKGFRVGTGPRGNYVQMGRGGLYYRASLGGGRRQQRSSLPVSHSYNHAPAYLEQAVPIETGNVFEMQPSNGAELLQQINDKLSLLRIWPWTLCVGIFLSIIVGGQPASANAVLPCLFLTLVLTALAWWWDQTRKAVVVMYDLEDDVAEKFRIFSEQFEAAGRVNRIWNIDTAENTSDWKRNAGAGRLLTRKSASFLDAVPSVVKTNVSVPCIKGGKQSLHFFPDIVLIVEGGKAGALSYEQLDIIWNTTIFIETDGVPSDSRTVGYTWRFVNKNGGPDRRFNNNRQIPKVEYQQMGIRGGGGLQKILHLPR